MHPHRVRAKACAGARLWQAELQQQALDEAPDSRRLHVDVNEGCVQVFPNLQRSGFPPSALRTTQPQTRQSRRLRMCTAGTDPCLQIEHERGTVFAVSEKEVPVAFILLRLTGANRSAHTRKLSSGANAVSRTRSAADD